METVQLALADRSYAAALREMLLRNGSWNVQCVDVPDTGCGGVIVVDRATLARIPTSLADPERVVLVTRNEPEDLSRAWDAGIISLVFESDPLNTAMLAVMAAALRLAKESRKEPACKPTAGLHGTLDGQAPRSGRG
jgi:hypothetical protein